MRSCFSTLCFLFCLTTSYSARTQTTTSQIPTTFQQQAQMAVSGGKPFSVVDLTATVQWIAGSLNQNGTAQLQTKLDGSSDVQLNLGQASRTETQTAIGTSRTCQWSDASGTSHGITGANCFVAMPWFAPSLFTQGLSLSSLVIQTDNGEVTDGTSTLHQISYQLNLIGQDSASTAQRVQASTVTVLYNPQTFLPASLEYKIHPDGDDLKALDVRVVFSNYQSVSGVMLPFQIERYINRTLQLKLDVSSASIE
jgi:hypothetical protein